MPALDTKLNARSADFQANAAAMRAVVDDLKAQIQDVQVVGVPDTRFGEELCAWVVIKPGQTLDEDGVRAFCKGKIAHYKVPRYIRFVSEFPMTVTGKIQKFKIRDAMIEELGISEQKTA